MLETWRQVTWKLIPPGMLELVVTFHSVLEIIHLNNAMTRQKDKYAVDLNDLIKSCSGALIPAFDMYRRRISFKYQQD